MRKKDYERKWIKNFCKGLSLKQMKKAGIGRLGGFLWHAFSYDFVPCLEGDEARKAYDNIDKTDALQAVYAFDRNANYFTICNERPITDEFMTAKQIDEADETEVYIIGKDYKWCYIRTHESLCGPYFHFRENK